MIYQILWICWSHWITVLFRENSNVSCVFFIDLLWCHEDVRIFLPFKKAVWWIILINMMPQMTRSLLPLASAKENFFFLAEQHQLEIFLGLKSHADDMRTMCGQHKIEISGKISLADDVCHLDVISHIICTSSACHPYVVWKRACRLHGATALHKAYWLPCFAFKTRYAYQFRNCFISSLCNIFSLEIKIKMCKIYSNFIWFKNWNFKFSRRHTCTDLWAK